jgi:hypothetical protein
MGKWKYTGDDERYFPTLTLIAQPGEIIEADDCPDGNWWTAVSDKRKPTADVAIDPTTTEA